MAYFYYQEGAETRQVEADSYQRIRGSQLLYTVTIEGIFRTVRCDDGDIQINFITTTKDDVPGPLGAVSFEPSGTGCEGGDRGVSLYIESNASQLFIENVWTGFPSVRKLHSYSVSAVNAETTGTSDNVEGACVTQFLRGGEVVLELSFCPPVDGDPRDEGCSACCRELLPIVRSLRV